MVDETSLEIEVPDREMVEKMVERSGCQSVDMMVTDILDAACRQVEHIESADIETETMVITLPEDAQQRYEALLEKYRDEDWTTEEIIEFLFMQWYFQATPPV